MNGLNEGAALNSQAKYDEVNQAFDMAIQLDPEYAKAWSNKGNALDKSGKYYDAI